MTKAYYMIVDTETNGFLTKGDRLVSPYSGRILQLAWALYTKRGKLIKQTSYYIKPKDYQVGATEIHGINETTLVGASDLMDVIPLWLADLAKVKAVVGHNVIFDESVLVNELNMYGKTELIEPFDDVAWICTQKLSKQLYGGTRCNLGSIYERVIGKSMCGAHNALVDVLCLGEIVTYWLQNKVIKASFTPYGSLDHYLTQKNKHKSPPS